MSVSNNDFYMLGMNIGSNQADYQLLLQGKTSFNDEDTIQNLFDKYKNQKSNPASKVAGENVSEKLFILLHSEKNIQIAVEDRKALASLLFSEGLDVLDNRLNTPFYQDLIKENSGELLEILNKRITDDYGARQFKNNYPNLNDMLRNNYNNSLPAPLQKTLLEKLSDFAKSLLWLSPMQRQLLSIKERLSINFFETIIKTPQKPAVITLQEVATSNKAVLNILEQNKYQIARPNDRSDTAIAFDTTRFKNPKTYALDGDSIAVHITDKKTKEEFVFVSVHIPGYKLEFPSENENLDNYLTNVEGSLESGAFRAVSTLKQEIDTLKSQHPKAQVILQGDFNSYPEYFKDSRVNAAIKKMDVFSFLQESDLSLLRSDLPTELNKQADSLNERELDYVFASKPLAGRVSMLIPEDQELSLAKITRGKEGNERSKVHFDPTLLFSDHRPLWVKVSQKEKA